MCSSDLWWHLSWPTLFCKNLEATPLRSCAAISRDMPNKSTTSEAVHAQANAAPEASIPSRKIYPIIKYGDPVLEKPGATISKFDAELGELAEDMFATMYAAQGIGLAAPQIGKSIRIAVVDVTGGKNPEAKIVLINPEVTHGEGEKREEEGCLSIPGFRGYVVRPQFVTKLTISTASFSCSTSVCSNGTSSAAKSKNSKNRANGKPPLTQTLVILNAAKDLN